MTRRFGISITEDGTFVEAGVHLTHRTAKISGIRRWAGHSIVNNFLLLSRSIALGLPSQWIRQLPDDTDDLATGGTPPSFSICTSRTEYDHYVETLRNNLAGVYSDDAFLATIPRHFAPNASESYLSLAAIDGAIKIGVIREKRLITAFSVRPSTHAELEGHIGRIVRYLRQNDPQFPDIGTRFLLTDIDFYDTAADAAVRISCGSDDPAVIKAAGCALCGCDDGVAVPRFCGPTKAAGFRFPRAALVVGSVAAVALTGLSAAALYGYNLKCADELSNAKRAYQHILSNNTEVKNLISEGDSIARKMIRVHDRLSKPTSWAPFLEALGTLRPPGLFVERLGSEPMANSASKLRIALGGWCESETVATDFIKALKKCRLLSGVTLASIERTGGTTTTCRYKIICVLSISE